VSILAPSRPRDRLWIAIAWILVFALPWVWPARALFIGETAAVALFALSLDLVLGYAGIVSLGHGAFLGVGAYAAGLFAKLVMPDPLLGMAVGIAVATAFGALCSLTVLRGSDLTRIMVTLGVSLLLYELANRFDTLTGGADGLQGMTVGPLLGRFEFDLQGQVAATYGLAVLLVALWLMRRLVRSPFGATLVAVRDNPLRAAAIGIPVAQRLSIAYTVAAAIAGAAGALVAQTSGFVSLEVFSIERSADVLLMLVIGGAGWLYGGVMGAVVFKVLNELIASVTPQYWTFWIGLFLVLLGLLGRERLLKPWLLWRPRPPVEVRR
jgi:branched-chain amino acid transport system permease protein